MTRCVDRTTSDTHAPVAVAAAKRGAPLSGRSGETADILDYMAQVRRKARSNADADPPVAGIVEALLAHGGRAHRDRVAERIASARADAPAKPTQALTARDRPALFYLPFGDGSPGWALAREAETFLRWGRESRRSSW